MNIPIYRRLIPTRLQRNEPSGNNPTPATVASQVRQGSSTTGARIALPPPPSTVAAPHGELTKRQRELWAQLPTAQNTALVELTQTAMELYPQGDSKRLAFSQVAMCFVKVGADAGNTAERIIGLVAQDQSILGDPTTAIVDGMEGGAALEKQLPLWARDLDESSWGRVANQLQYFEANGPGYAAIAEYTKTKDALALDPQALKQPVKTIQTYRQQQLGPEPPTNRALPDQLVKFASNLADPSIAGMKHELVEFARRLFTTDDSTEGRTLFHSADRHALLMALVRQLGEEGAFGSLRTQHEVIRLVTSQLTIKAKGLNAAEIAEVSGELARVLERLSHGRLSGIRDVQGTAVDAVCQGMRLDDLKCAARVMLKALDHVDGWSRSRRSADETFAPGTRTGIARATLTHVAGVFIGLTPTAKAAAKIAVGRPSVRTTALQEIAARLNRATLQDLTVDEVLPTLEVCRRILQTPPEGVDSAHPLHQAALNALVHCGLPRRGDPFTLQTRYVTAALGADPDKVTSIAKELMEIAAGNGIGHHHPYTQMAAIRYLHHLVASGRHKLTDVELQHCKELVADAVRLMQREPQKTALQTRSLLTDLCRANAPWEHDLALDIWREAVDIGLNKMLLDVMLDAPGGPSLHMFEHLCNRLPTSPDDGERETAKVRLLRASLQNCISVARDSAQHDQWVQMASALWDRLNANHQAALAQHLVDGWADRPPQAQAVALDVILSIKDKLPAGHTRFVEAIGALMSDAGQDIDAPGPLADSLRLLKQAIKADDYDALVDAHASATQDLPAANWKLLIDNAQHLDNLHLPMLIDSWLRCRGEMDQAKVDVLEKAWKAAQKKLQDAGGQNALAALIQDTSDALTPQEAEAALNTCTTFDPVMLARLRAALTPQRLREIAIPLLDKLFHSGQRPDRRVDVAALALEAAPEHALEGLASEIGDVQTQAGRPVKDEAGRPMRYQLDRKITTAHGTTTLGTELRSRSAEQIMPALEALAERYDSILDPSAVKALLNQWWPSLSDSQRQRLRETLFLGNRYMAAPHASIVGESPNDAAWKGIKQKLKNATHDVAKRQLSRPQANASGKGNSTSSRPEDHGATAYRELLGQLRNERLPKC